MSEINQALAEHLQQYPELLLAVLFGSQATGQVTLESDIDIGLLANSPLSNDHAQRIREGIANQFGRAVDLVDLFDAPEPITGQVLKGTRLFGENEVYARLMAKHLVNSADFLPIHQRILQERRQAWIS